MNGIEINLTITRPNGNELKFEVMINKSVSTEVLLELKRKHLMKFFVDSDGSGTGPQYYTLSFNFNNNPNVMKKAADSLLGISNFFTDIDAKDLFDASVVSKFRSLEKQESDDDNIINKWIVAFKNAKV
ncbi:MAG: hypothetical protein RsTaC01_1031 [Candidatus Paraimprobicoccus trichonymphae]|uniref:Uncharacterized protein n=1 Tax=Candidatus Paraimprobicoccus trichonymphae TaxID=3033793 RepID=A0AA48L1N2_9FIRM|nr:MAG: hypothetical protein RsTaC01_1031 [Candidatus Paraimprobicoccus trichonymphae]